MHKIFLNWTRERYDADSVVRTQSRGLERLRHVMQLRIRKIFGLVQQRDGWSCEKYNFRGTDGRAKDPRETALAERRSTRLGGFNCGD
jgi:hypothetical protein